MMYDAALFLFITSNVLGLAELRGSRTEGRKSCFGIKALSNGKFGLTEVDNNSPVD